jgi:hypothetical protein
MKRRTLAGPVTLGLPLLVAGAVSAACRTAEAPGTVTPGASAGPSGPTGGAMTRDEAVRRASADAAARAGVPAAQVRTVQAADREWPDGSLGCPEPGRFYTQAIVPGYVIELDANGRRLTYHADRQGTVLLCEAGRPQPVR